MEVVMQNRLCAKPFLQEGVGMESLTLWWQWSPLLFRAKEPGCFPRTVCDMAMAIAPQNEGANLVLHTSQKFGGHHRIEASPA